jgi:pyrroloquinoline quinone biosynthesis protein B
LDVIVLGSAAGGGVPQWNCRCPVCRLAWAGDPRVRPRTQSSLAVSLDSERWVLLNASPDIRQQILATPALHPAHGKRGSPIAAVVLTNGDLDHVAGLLGLRERQAFTVFATGETLSSLVSNPAFAVLDADLVERRRVELGRRIEPVQGLSIELFAVPGKAPLWLEGPDPTIGRETETTVGALIEGRGRRVAYVPGCATVNEGLKRRIEGVDLLFFDGTLWRDDEMITMGLSEKTGRRMGHSPMSGEDGSIAALAAIDVGKRVFVHINNTNPVLVEDSDERRAADAAGWTVAHDGMRFVL